MKISDILKVRKDEIPLIALGCLLLAGLAAAPVFYHFFTR